MLLVSHDRDFLDRVVTSTLASEGAGRWVEYAGGYSDMLAQRGPALEPEPARAGKGLQSTRSAAKPAKLSFKDKLALEALPSEISALERKVAALQTELADADLYRRRPARFAEATAALSSLQAQLAQAEERWLDLEAKREALEAAR